MNSRFILELMLLLRLSCSRYCCVSALQQTVERRDLLFASAAASSQLKASSAHFWTVSHPESYEAVVYTPTKEVTKAPVLLVLHGAGKNEAGVWSLADINGEHAGLAPSLLASGRAPRELAENFVVVAPFVGQGRRSFYEEPRRKLLEFIQWFTSDEGRTAGCPQNIDTQRISLFGFSDGATVAVELLTTQRFAAGVIASYGFTGTLPPQALNRLSPLPIWVFHCKTDAIFPVACSDRLVAALRAKSLEDGSSDFEYRIRYTRFDDDQEGFTGVLRGHTTGITASRRADVYEWLLSNPPSMPI